MPIAPAEPRHAKVPEWLIDRLSTSEISANALALFTILWAKYMNRDTREARPGRARLARDLGLGRKSTRLVTVATNQLLDVGALTVTKRKRQHTAGWEVNRYHLTSDQAEAGARASARRAEKDRLEDENDQIAELATAAESRSQKCSTPRAQKLPRVGHKSAQDPESGSRISKPDTTATRNTAANASVPSAKRSDGATTEKPLRRAQHPEACAVARKVIEGGSAPTNDPDLVEAVGQRLRGEGAYRPDAGIRKAINSVRAAIARAHGRPLKRPHRVAESDFSVSVLAHKAGLGYADAKLAEQRAADERAARTQADAMAAVNGLPEAARGALHATAEAEIAARCREFPTWNPSAKAVSVMIAERMVGLLIDMADVRTIADTAAALVASQRAEMA